MLPVSDAVLRRHQEVIANLHLRFRSKRFAERQQQREMYRTRHEPHSSHYVVSQNVLQVRIGQSGAVCSLLLSCVRRWAENRSRARTRKA